MNIKPYHHYLHEALEIITGETGFSCDSNGKIIGLSGIPEQSIIDAKIQELQAAEPMRLLRLERDRRIALTDWRFRSDLNPKQEWYEYCQALRDLPSTAEPMLDEDGNLTNVTWPEEPTV